MNELEAFACAQDKLRERSFPNFTATLFLDPIVLATLLFGRECGAIED